MRTIRPARRPAVVFAATALVAASLVISATSASSVPQELPGPSLNRIEHEAQQQADDVRRERSRLFDEHEAKVHFKAPPAFDAELCTAKLAQTWRDLGRFSDSRELHLISLPPCRR